MLLEKVNPSNLTEFNAALSLSGRHLKPDRLLPWDGGGGGGESQVSGFNPWGSLLVWKHLSPNRKQSLPPKSRASWLDKVLLYHNGSSAQHASQLWFLTDRLLVEGLGTTDVWRFSLTDWFCLLHPETAAWSSMFKATLFANWTIGETPENSQFTSLDMFDGGRCIFTCCLERQNWDPHVDQFQTWRTPNFLFHFRIPHLNFDSAESISSENVQLMI